jgi:serine/threonine protein kinase
MPEYSCFLHPLQKGDSLKALCPICKEAFGFPETNFPVRINDRPVQGKGTRGFYGVVYETAHPVRPNLKFATKVIPRATYASLDKGGYGKNFDEEVTLHQELEATGLIPHLTDFGEATLGFGRHDIPCYWMEMEYVPGVTLAEKIDAGPDDPREIAQIAWDLLDFIQALEQRHRFHNDLHGNNIKIRTLSDYEARREAIHPRLRVVILDAGSAAERSKSGPDRLGDVHWIARHIIDLLNAYEKTKENVEPSTLRICAQLRRIAEICLGVDHARAPKPQDMKKTVYEAYRFGERPWRQPVQLSSISEHTMP